MAYWLLNPMLVWFKWMTSEGPMMPTSVWRKCARDAPLTIFVAIGDVNRTGG